MTKVCRTVSAAVEGELAGKYGSRAFVVAYDAKAGTLVVEAYSCHTFNIEVDFALSQMDVTGRSVSRRERWSYAREGVRVQQSTASGSASYRMPAFGSIAMDKCANEKGKDCTIALTGIAPKTSDNRLVLTPTFGEGVNVEQLAFHWRVDAPSLMYSERPQVAVTTEGATPIQVQLLVIDREKLCWAFTATSIERGRSAPIRRTRRRR
jgi:hypothetical protein